ncbi:TonB-dependent receptor [Xanthomonas rydalmerensis]|uniref:TonB-dependent receptor n=1 Tax=Xanthomonas rydalmerensis TaxID=3046274 RepID=A0ABZ0JQ63_9XANT|nr:TonB-dependent receptor [Xanthomonas sp. DM-2023]WOS41946.1 TonB-dependent receptor [Xanthomonas sp. DM-2023]WOS46132.1 TonB-dependent receptor [Xanthomonas sp. DM-2023]WOS50310.1 TonB-dependent receptor [Xanthomonas sp. DM-2023]WOS54490.1 TonB-dependent receptor [Xanthomonas sp. DM-2023]WOS58673.1 TonB-dependent receptor [Xanthomonas sp. DM-2023]
MSSPFVRPLSLAIALALAAPAFAQEAAPATATNLDTVIVTGTRASGRTVLESTAPVDVLSAEDIRKAGVVNGELGSALQALLPSFNFPRQSNSGGADHVRAAQLRGLSPDQVLVLVNGKRRHTSALVNTDSKIGKGTTPVDFNAIPISAIKRIEVLRDGAGAQYGSDAVAGVINVILDDDPDSGALEASYGANHTDVKPIHRTLTDGQTGYASGKVGTRLGEDGGFFKVGLELKNHEATNRAGFDQIPPFEEQTPANLALAGKRNYELGDGASKDLNAWINGKLPFGQGSDVYAFGTYNQRDTQGANYFRYPDGAANWTQVYPQGYRPVSLGENRDLQAVLGARGQWGEWAYDASLDYGRNDFTYRLKHSLNASLGPGSPTRFKTGDYAFEQGVANLDLSRSFDAAGATHTVGTGVELRREHYRTRPGDPASYAAGPYTDRPTGAQAGGGLTPQDAADLSRNVASVYASVSSQFGDKLSTDLAARYEHYQDFGGELTGKLAARYEFVPAFALRGAISNNFRAPSLSQIGYEASSTGYNANGQLLQGRLLSVDNPIAQALGARTLQPEKSRNYSLGFTSRVGSHFDLSLDLFQIDIDKRIALSESIDGDALTDFVAQRFGITGLQSASFFVNAADTRTRGAELVSNWRQALGQGQLQLTGTWSYAKTELENVVATPAQLLALNPDYVLFGVEERNTLTEATPRTRAQLAANWSDARWSLQTRVTRYGSATRVFDFGDGFAPEQTYRAKWQLDAEVEYHLTPQWSVAVGGQNLTDAYADRSKPDIAYFGNLPYDVLSPIGSNGAYYYGRVRYTF